MSARVGDPPRSRLARLAARLRDVAADAGIPIRRITSGTEAEPQALARAMIDSRRSIAAFFPEELFADPVRDLLIELYAAGELRKSVSVRSACMAAAVPPTTAFRCIALLKARGLILVDEDSEDGRPAFLRLSADAHRQMERYLADVAARLARAAPAPAVPR